jgi:hypothetical protein
MVYFLEGQKYKYLRLKTIATKQRAFKKLFTVSANPLLLSLCAKATVYLLIFALSDH